MPRGKNYVNNNKGVFLQGNKSKTTMKACEYGAACTRKDCIYRHDDAGGKSDEICLPFLAGKCTFKGDACRKRHPKKEEKNRLIAKYKRTRCRFGDECYTDGCLYLHPREVEPTVPHFVEPHHVAFPPLNGTTAPQSTQPNHNSAWKATPAVAPQTHGSQPHMTPPPGPTMAPPGPSVYQGPPQGWYPAGMPMYPPNVVPPTYFDPAMQGQPMPMYGGPMPPNGMPIEGNFNAEAKEFIPQSFVQ